MTDTGDHHDRWYDENRPTGGPDVDARPDNGRGLWAMILGIGAAVLAFIVPPIGLLLGIVAVVLGVSGRRRAASGRASNPRQATAGLVTGIVAVVVGALFSAVIGSFIWSNRDELNDLQRCLEQAQTEAEQTQCQTEFEQQVGD